MQYPCGGSRFGTAYAECLPRRTQSELGAAYFSVAFKVLVSVAVFVALYAVWRLSGKRRKGSKEMTKEELNAHLICCEKAVQSTKPILAKHRFPDDYRTVTVIGFISTVIEHQESVLLLAMHDKAGSAAALVRPIVEGAFRGLWINLPATEAEVKKFNADDKIDLGFGEIATALDDAYGMGDFFQDFKTRAWKALNSYTHGGMQQIGRRFIKHEVANNYSEGEIYEMTTTVTTMVLILTSFFLKKQGHAAEGDEIQALLETFGPTAHGKK
jgi:hypothetical protein